MNGQVRQGETLGSLDQRILALENNKWNSWFGKHPGAVLGIVIATLVSAFWFYHTWQIERIDKNYQTEIANLEKQNKGKIDWLKDQQKITTASAEDKCGIEKERISSQLAKCVSSNKQNISSAAGNLPLQ